LVQKHLGRPIDTGQVHLPHYCVISWSHRHT